MREIACDRVSRGVVPVCFGGCFFLRGLWFFDYNDSRALASVTGELGSTAQSAWHTRISCIKSVSPLKSCVIFSIIYTYAHVGIICPAVPVCSV